MSDERFDLLTDLAAGEDEFDVDLMAAGCRIAHRATAAMAGPEELVSLYGFGADEIVAVLGLLVADGTVDSKALFSAAEQVASGRAAQPDQPDPA
jgi:hypothetical protein